MAHNNARRHFLKVSGSLSTLSVLGAASVSACGGGSTGAEPLTTTQQLGLTATHAMAALNAGTLTATEYVNSLIAQIQAHSDLNALIYLDQAGARAAAAQVDAKRKAGQAVGLLAGLPIMVKDNINTKAMPTTGGTPGLSGVQPGSNAPSLQKLIDAGAIVLGKTNLHELAFGATSTNFTLGQSAGTPKTALSPCKNPYDTTRSPGGSSGGTAASIAARFAPAGLGTDTGGSTRVPAALCGIAGFRPSVGDSAADGSSAARRYPNDFGAVVPISHTRDTVGPMARTVADVALLDSVMSGSTLPVAKTLSQVRLGVPATFWKGLDPQLLTVVNAAKAKLSAAGVTFVDVDLDVMALNDSISFPVALHEPVADIPAYLAATAAAGGKGLTGVSLSSINTAVASPDVQGAFGAIMGDVFGGNAYNTAMANRVTLQNTYSLYFSTNTLDAVIFPTTITPAPVIDAINGSSPAGEFLVNGSAPVGADGSTKLSEFSALIRNTDPISNAGLPGLSIPAGLTSAGLPVGLEIDGPLGSDTQLLAIGMAIEAVLGSMNAPSL